MDEQLKKILNIIEIETNNKNSVWNKELLIKFIKPEIEELYNYFKNGKIFFKFGKSQRMLESTYIITDSIEKLSNTDLGKEILKFQEMYNKL